MTKACPACGDKRRPRRRPLRVALGYLVLGIIAGPGAVKASAPRVGLLEPRCPTCGMIAPPPKRQSKAR